ncbi:MAG: type II toxin-antitoxin system HicA family toxin [Bacteroidia bacterium]
MIKYRDFIRHLRASDCTLVRQGSNHEIWNHSSDGIIKQSSVPRHPNLVKQTCWAICKQLEIPKFPVR